MERRDFLKIALGVVAGAAAMAASARAAPLYRKRWPRMAGCPPIRMLILPSRRAMKWIASSRKKCAGATAIIAAGVIVTGAGAAAVIGAGAVVIWGLAPQALGLASPPPLVPPPLLASPLLVGRRDGLIPQALSTQAFNTSTKKAPHEAGLFIRSGNVR